MSDTNLITINIDGAEAKVPAGINAIEAAKRYGKEVPHYCYHPHLKVAGSCRMCFIEMGTPAKDPKTGEMMKNEDGSAKIAWAPRPVIGCATNVSPGMHIRTKSSAIDNCRESVMEFLLINHPLDCPICDKAGECMLQEHASGYGRGCSRFTENKVVKPKRTVLGPRVMLDDERCVLCSRCIRFTRDVAGEDVLGFVNRGSYNTLTCYPGRELNHNYSLNVTDICPVGALTSRDFRFRMRVWFLKRTKSICAESSVGTNTELWSREGVIHRITPRENTAVNDSWMTDSGRELYKQVDAPGRLKNYLLRGAHVSVEAAVEAAVACLKAGHVAVVGNGGATVEEAYLLKRLADATKAKTFYMAHLDEADGLLLSEDRTPNVRGALLAGLIKSLPETSADSVVGAVYSGEVKTLVVFNEDIGSKLDKSALDNINIIYFGDQWNATAEMATIAFPTTLVFEKSGSFVNYQFRLQRFTEAIPAPAGVLHMSDVLSRLLGAFGLFVDGHSMAAVWKHLAEEIPQFSGIRFESIGDLGVPVDGSAFSGLDFPEKSKGLHFPGTK